MQDAKPQVSPNFRTADEDRYFAALAERYSHRDRRRREVKWIRHGWRDICDLARSFPSTAAFVLGSGPSNDVVTLKQWEGIEKHFSVCVNTFPEWFAEKFGREWRGPLCFISDFFEGESWQRMRELLQAYRKAGGKLLVAFDGCQMEHDFCAPVKGGDLDDDPEFNITLSHAIDAGFNRSVFGACYIAGLVPARINTFVMPQGPPRKYFQNICLLGVDHGADYFETEPPRATECWWHFKDWAATHNVQLWQCGTKSAFCWECLSDQDKVNIMHGLGKMGPQWEAKMGKIVDVPKKSLARVLTGKWEGARRRKVKK